MFTNQQLFMERVVKRVAISGATIALIMNDLSSTEGDSDGLLFGQLLHQSLLNLEDDATGSAITREEFTARITGYCRTGALLSFYDDLGRLNQSKLQEMILARQFPGADPPIGWCVGRRNSAMRPSMREAAVTSYLRSNLSSFAFGRNSSDLGTSFISLNERLDRATALPKDRWKNDTMPLPGEAELCTSMSSNCESIGIVLPECQVTGGLSSISELQRSKLNASDLEVGSSLKGQTDANGVGAEPSSVGLFLLFTVSNSSNVVQTQEYRAFQYMQMPKGAGFEPLGISIVNTGLAYRAFYSSFIPVSPLVEFLSHQTFEKERDSKLLSVPKAKQKRCPGAVSSFRSSTEFEKCDDAVNLLCGSEGNCAHHSVSPNVALGMHVHNSEGLYALTLLKLDKLVEHVCDTPTAPCSRYT